MKLLLLCLCLGVIEVSALAVPTGVSGSTDGSLDLSCEGDGRYRFRCNWCRCDGGRSLCTKRGCPAGLAERLEGEPECEGNITFRRDCNTCICVDRRAICTEKSCVSDGKELIQLRSTNAEPECTTGSRWRVDCNWCTCNELGQGICTKKGCPTEPTEEEKEEPHCEGTSRWRQDCNWCNCVDGRGLCTLKACGVDVALPPQSDVAVSHPSLNPKPLDDEVLCTNGSRFRDECNWCNCGETGVPSCTIILCIPELIEASKNEPMCIGNSKWKRDCNWCNCANGKAVCTLKECWPGVDTRESQEVCTNGSRWKEDCNWCRCNNGVGVCTKRLCPEGLPEQTDEPECEGNSRWKRDCNWCNCVEGRAICTEIGCTQGSASDACEEGTAWNDGCNFCECRKGLIICTQAVCPDVVDIQLQCEEGSSWKEDCNTCHCTNGLPMCTKMSCSVPRHCLLPAIRNDEPLCEGFQLKWTFDSATRQCKSIVYGGCGGTDNLFDSKSDCFASCVMPVKRGISLKGSGRSVLGQQIEEDLTESQTKCLLPQDQGPCFGALPRFFYNKVTGNCERFTFGGCLGNGNRFFTLEDCQDTCAGIAPATGIVISSE